MGILDRFFSFLSPGRNKNNIGEDEILLKKLEELKSEVLSKIEEKSGSINDAFVKNTSDDFLARAVVDFLSLLKDSKAIQSVTSDPEFFKKRLTEEILKNLIYPEQLYQDFQNDPVKHIFKELFLKFHEIDKSELPSLTSKGALYKQVIEPIISSLQSSLSVSNRIKLYKTIEQLYYSFPIARRIVREYTNSIINEDLVGGDYLYISENEKVQKYLGVNYGEVKSEIERVINLIRVYINDKELLKQKILPEVAIKGDAYIEVIDKKEFLLSNAFTLKYVPKKPDIIIDPDSISPDDFSPELLLTENVQEELSKSLEFEVNKFIAESSYLLTSGQSNAKDKTKSFVNLIDKSLDLVSKSLLEVELPHGAPSTIEEAILHSDNSFNLIIYEGTNNNSSGDNNPEEKISENILQNLKQIDYKKIKSRIELKFHKPEYVIPIHDEDKVYGYIVLSPTSPSDPLGAPTTTTQTILQKLGQIVDRLSILKQSESDKVTKTIYLKLIDYFYQNVLNSLKTFIQKTGNDIPGIENNPEDKLTHYSARLNQILNLLSQNEKIKEEFFLALQDIIFEKTFSKLKVRFVFPENIIHFYFNIEKFPYGESILSPVMLHSTLYLVSVYSNILYRLTRTPLYTKYQVNAGSMKDWKSYLHRLVNELRTKRLTIDDIGNIDRIREYVTDFKFMFEVLENGAPIISQTLERLGDPNVRIQDIQDYKQDIAMMSEIPSMRLGFMDGTELREKIIDANIQFAQKITNIQRNFEKSLNKLFSTIIFKLTDYKIEIDPMQILRLRFHEPISLKLLQIQNVISVAATIVSSISQIPGAPQQIDLFKMLQKLIPSLNWDEFKLQNTTDKQSELEQQLNPNNNNQQQQQQQSGGFGGF